MSIFSRKHTNGSSSGATVTSAMENGSRRILEEIASHADREASVIIAEAEKIAAERKAFARKKAETINADAKRRAEEQALQVKQEELSGLAVAVRRETMKMHDRLLNDVTVQVLKKLAELVGKSSYRTVLADWITEAALGLDVPNAVVNASAAERTLISEPMLQEVSERVSRETGRLCRLECATGTPLDGQGVVVTAADGRTAYNNQVHTRMRRFDRIIRERVYTALFTGQPSTGRQGREADKP